MATLSRDEFINRIQDRVGTDKSDEAITFVEDMIDTYNDLEKKANSEVDWEQRYHELDESWKERYRHRFFTAGADNINSGVKANADPVDDDGYDPEDVSVSDLFEDKS